MISSKDFRNFTVGFTLVISIGLGALLLWQYLNGGIPGHYFLARKDMPLISNGWGGITVPLFSWFILGRIHKRLFGVSTVISFPKHTLIAFLGSLMYGVILGVSIQGGIRVVSGNTPWFIALAALAFPIYRAEYFLGFVLGLTYWVGGVLPIVVGSVFVLAAFAIYTFIRTPIESLLRRL